MGKAKRVAVGAAESEAGMTNGKAEVTQDEWKSMVAKRRAQMCEAIVLWWLKWGGGAPGRTDGDKFDLVEQVLWVMANAIGVANTVGGASGQTEGGELDQVKFRFRNYTDISWAVGGWTVAEELTGAAGQIKKMPVLAVYGNKGVVPAASTGRPGEEVWSITPRWGDTGRPSGGGYDPNVSWVHKTVLKVVLAPLTRGTHNPSAYLSLRISTGCQSETMFDDVTPRQGVEFDDAQQCWTSVRAVDEIIYDGLLGGAGGQESERVNWTAGLNSGAPAGSHDAPRWGISYGPQYVRTRWKAVQDILPIPEDITLYLPVNLYSYPGLGRGQAMDGWPMDGLYSMDGTVPGFEVLAFSGAVSMASYWGDGVTEWECDEKVGMDAWNAMASREKLAVLARSEKVPEAGTEADGKVALAAVVMMLKLASVASSLYGAMYTMLSKASTQGVSAFVGKSDTLLVVNRMSFPVVILEATGRLANVAGSRFLAPGESTHIVLNGNSGWVEHLRRKAGKPENKQRLGMLSIAMLLRKGDGTAGMMHNSGPKPYALDVEFMADSKYGADNGMLKTSGFTMYRCKLHRVKSTTWQQDNSTWWDMEEASLGAAGGAEGVGGMVGQYMSFRPIAWGGTVEEESLGVYLSADGRMWRATQADQAVLVLYGRDEL